MKEFFNFLLSVLVHLFYLSVVTLYSSLLGFFIYALPRVIGNTLDRSGIFSTTLYFSTLVLYFIFFPYFLKFMVAILEISNDKFWVKNDGEF
jgi:hypothetical protein